METPKTNKSSADRPPLTAAPAIIVGQHYPSLDGIRGIAILLVLVFHCRIIVSPQNSAETLALTLAETGWIGVDLFFVLSGFLITGILLDTSQQKHYFRNFYLRRVLRIFPLYYAVIAISMLISQFGQLEPFSSESAVVKTSYWFYAQNWLFLFDLRPVEILGHFWSLAIEEQFYLIWPALVYVAARHNAAGKLCVTTIIAAFIVRAALVSAGQLAYFFTVSRIDTLALGALVAVLFRRGNSLRRYRAPALGLAALSGLVITALIIRLGRLDGHDPDILVFGLLPLAALFASFLVIALTARNRGFLRLLLENSWLRFVGKISYGIYIFHWPIVVLLAPAWPFPTDNYWLTQSGFLAVVTTFSIALAWFSYRFFESRFLRLKGRFAYA